MDKIEKCDCPSFHNNMKKKKGVIIFMRTGLIYKFTNKINGKIYIGQTTCRLQDRINKHLQDTKNDELYFHRALKKYGIDNFSIEVIEDFIPLEKLDEKEIYQIKITDAYYTSGKGYNMTKGGKRSTSKQLICGSAEMEIKDLLKNSNITFQTIANDFGVSLTCISDINRGRSFYEANLDYPIRKTPNHTKLNNDLVKKIIDMLKNDLNLSIVDIGLTLGISNYTVGEINRGKNSWCPKDLNYPIRKNIKKNVYQNKLSELEVQNICYQLIFTSNTLQEIANSYNIGKNTVGDISRGVTWKETTNQFKLPIRKNKLDNQEIYKSIYGIV